MSQVVACTALERGLDEAGVPWERIRDGQYTATLPGEARLRTVANLVVGSRSVELNAFVARRPDENLAGVHRWLLERNARLFGAAFALDRAGDIYLTGRLPLAAIDPVVVDQWLGSVLEAADDSFNRILNLGFASSIRNEWRWRLARGESTRNLAAFEHLRPADAGARTRARTGAGGPARTSDSAGQAVDESQPPATR